jgi:hypothetical protein
MAAVMARRSSEMVSLRVMRECGANTKDLNEKRYKFLYS